MKYFCRLLTIISVAALGLVFSSKVFAETDVSVGVSISAPADFYAPLTPAGTWVEVGGYGRCWRPTSVAVGWRPYCDGHWEWTDCGWYWVSDEPWAWACYHYGNWAFVDGGWFWVPGTEWAPAWVYWRVGGGYCGWAPCPPRGHRVADVNFVFVDEHHFRDHHRPSTVIVNNTTIIKKTKEITTVKREERDIGGRRQRVVVNDGPKVADVQKASGKKIERVSVTEANRQTIEHAPAEIRQRSVARTGNQMNNDKKVSPKEQSPAESKGPAHVQEDQPHPRDSKAVQPERRVVPTEPNEPIQKSRIIKPDEKPDLKPSEHVSPPDNPKRIEPPVEDRHTAPLVPQNPAKESAPILPRPNEHREVIPDHHPDAGESHHPEGGGERPHEGGGPGRGKDKP